MKTVKINIKTITMIEKQYKGKTVKIKQNRKK